MDDLLACPRCKTTKYRNPALKLLVNTCGHALCDNCVELLFVKGSGPCPAPECGIPLRRAGFRVQLFEDPAVEKEVDIRRRVLKDFTKLECDFPSLREYNDYLEQVETIIFNLVNNIDIIETNRQIEQYKKENKEQISKSRHRKPTELLELEQLLLEEARLNELRHLESLKSEKAEKLRKLKSQDALIDDLMFSDGDAKSIVEQHKAVVSSAQQDQQNGETKGFLSQLQHGITTAASTAPGSSTSHNTFTSGISFGSRNTSTFLPVPKVEEVPLFVYRALELEFCGPSPPSKEHLLQSATTTSSSMYLSHIRPASEAEIAGGYHHLLACRRALQDAFMDIAMQPELLVAHKIEGMDTS